MKSPGKNEALPRQARPWPLGFTVPGGGCFLSLCPWVGDAGDSGRDVRVHAVWNLACQGQISTLQGPSLCPNSPVMGSPGPYLHRVPAHL